MESSRVPERSVQNGNQHGSLSELSAPQKTQDPSDKMSTKNSNSSGRKFLNAKINQDDSHLSKILQNESLRENCPSLKEAATIDKSHQCNSSATVTQRPGSRRVKRLAWLPRSVYKCNSCLPFTSCSKFENYSKLINHIKKNHRKQMICVKCNLEFFDSFIFSLHKTSHVERNEAQTKSVIITDTERILRSGNTCGTDIEKEGTDGNGLEARSDVSNSHEKSFSTVPELHLQNEYVNIISPRKVIQTDKSGQSSMMILKEEDTQFQTSENNKEMTSDDNYSSVILESNRTWAVDEEPRKEQQAWTEEDEFVCTTCRGEFQDKTQLVKHLRQDHADQFFCEECNEIIFARKLFDTHMQRQHGHRVENNDTSSTEPTETANHQTAILEIDTGKFVSTAVTKEVTSHRQETHQTCLQSREVGQYSNKNNTFRPVDETGHSSLAKKASIVWSCEECDKEFISFREMDDHSDSHKKINTDEKVDLTQIDERAAVENDSELNIHPISSFPNEVNTPSVNQFEETNISKPELDTRSKHQLMNPVVNFGNKPSSTESISEKTSDNDHEEVPEQVSKSADDLDMNENAADLLEDDTECEAELSRNVSELGSSDEEVEMTAWTMNDERHTLTCTCCLKEFRFKHLVIEHYRKVHLERFVCEHCNIAFSHAGAFAHHMIQHSETRSSKSCPFCQHDNIPEKSIYDHVDEEHYNHCQLCRQKFFHPRSFREHNNKEHLDINPFVCEVCGKPFRSEQYLHTHQISYHKVHIEGALLPTQCFICRKSYKTAKHMRVHMRSAHINPSGRFLCDICGASYVQSNHFRVHCRTHTGEKPFICDSCGKCFAGKRMLQRHVLTHTGDKPFSCKHCNENFSHYTSFSNHVKRHTGERPFKCRICDKGFITKQPRNSHEEKCMIRLAERTKSDQ